MFDQLVYSKARGKLRPARGLAVAALHGIVIAGAIRATAGGTVPAPTIRADTTVFVLETPLRPIQPAAPADAPTVTAAAPLELATPPTAMPTSLPPPDLGPRLDPALLTGRFPLLGPGTPGADSTSAVRVLAAGEVDQPAEVVSQPKPRYPPVLERAGLDGRVVVEFIIDTVGHCERGSLRVVESSHSGFNPAAEETIQRSLFRPARIRGHAVRQRAFQAIVFRITPE